MEYTSSAADSTFPALPAPHTIASEDPSSERVASPQSIHRFEVERNKEGRDLPALPSSDTTCLANEKAESTNVVFSSEPSVEFVKPAESNSESNHGVYSRRVEFNGSSKSRWDYIRSEQKSIVRDAKQGDMRNNGIVYGDRTHHTNLPNIPSEHTGSFCHPL